jgi:nucleotide-binding universal stress UspA family protein
MKKILVPTDFSECAKAATDVAVALAQKAGAELFFLHICQDPNMEAHVPAGIERPQQEEDTQVVHSRNELSLLVNDAEKLGLKARQILVFDNGNDRIENYIEPYGIDFIVMGSHGVKGIREFVIGSNTQRIVRHVHVPVLVIKERPASVDFKNIVFASTFDHGVVEAFNEVAAFAMLLHSTVNLVYINFVDRLVAPADANKKMQALALKYPALQCSTNLAETNDEEWAIHQFAEELEADLISVPAKEKDGLIPLLSSTIAEELVNHEHKPVLVLNT